MEFVDSLFIGYGSSESVFQARGEGADTNLKWTLPVRSLHFSKGNISRALFECPTAISFLLPAIKRNRNSTMEWYFLGGWRRGAAYDESFKYCRSRCVRKQNNDNHWFSPGKKDRIQVLDLALLISGWI